MRTLSAQMCELHAYTFLIRKHGSAFAKTAVWDQADQETQEAFAELVELLGDDCHDLPLSEPFEHAVEMHRTIMNADLAKNLAGYYERGRDKLTSRLCEMIEIGQKVSAVDYNKAVDGREALNSGLSAAFDHYDIIITPATPGEAPAGAQGLAGSEVRLYRGLIPQNRAGGAAARGSTSGRPSSVRIGWSSDEKTSLRPSSAT